MCVRGDRNCALYAFNCVHGDRHCALYAFDWLYGSWLPRVLTLQKMIARRLHASLAKFLTARSLEDPMEDVPKKAWLDAAG